MHQNSILPFLLLALVIGLVIVAKFVQSSPKAPKLKPIPFMTDAEIAFYLRLREAAAPLNIAPQVAMSAIVTTSGGDQSQRRATRNQFDRKVIDYVVFDDAGRVRLLVELDDSTHRQERDVARDSLTASAGYQTLRMRGSEAKDVAAIRIKVESALKPAAVPEPRTLRQRQK